jgi:hypothetical protein
MATTAAVSKVSPAKKEDIDAKVSKTKYIKEAFAKLGIDAPASEIVAYIKAQNNETIKPQYIYLIKSKMMNPNKKPAKRNAVANVKASEKSVRKQTSAGRTQADQFTETYTNIQNLIRFFGGKNQLIRAIDSI